MATARQKSPEPLRPCTLKMTLNDDTELKFTSETYSGIIWLYNFMRRQVSKPWKQMEMFTASGHPLKVRLVIRSEVCLETDKEDVVYEDTVAEDMHDKGWMQT